MAGLKGVKGGAHWQDRTTYMDELNARFWARVKKTETCWLWTGPKVGMGYGKLGAFGKTARAHRVSWQLVHGKIPDGMLVLHNCPDGDNPACVRPDHLFLGNFDQNNKDMASKNRSAKGDRSRAHKYPETIIKGDQHYARTNPEKLLRGERHGMAKLTEQNVIEIRQRYKAGNISKKELAIMFGVSSCPIDSIIRGKTWRHVHGDY